MILLLHCLQNGLQAHIEVDLAFCILNEDFKLYLYRVKTESVHCKGQKSSKSFAIRGWVGTVSILN